jgi:hypothetical protein
MRKTSIVPGALLLMVGSLAAGPPGWSIDATGKLTVPLVRKAAAGESLVLRLKVGMLPDGAKIVVSTLDKQIAGGVAPFGIRPGRMAGVYSIPVPGKAVIDNKVTLRLEVVVKGVKPRRPPFRTEIEEATLEFSPEPPTRKP